MAIDPIKASIFRCTFTDLHVIRSNPSLLLFFYSQRSSAFLTWMWAQKGSSLPTRVNKHLTSDLLQITMSPRWHLTMKLNCIRSKQSTHMQSKMHFDKFQNLSILLKHGYWCFGLLARGTGEVRTKGLGGRVWTKNLCGSIRVRHDVRNRSKN